MIIYQQQANDKGPGRWFKASLGHQKGRLVFNDRSGGLIRQLDGGLAKRRLVLLDQPGHIANRISLIPLEHGAIVGQLQGGDLARCA